MIVRCKNCLPAEGITIPDFTQADKQVLHELKDASPVNCIMRLVEKYKLTPGDAKYITIHINKELGRCNRCGKQIPTEEYSICPRCGSLNFNWKINYHVAGE